MKLQYFGHSCFALTCADGTTLVLDPFDETVPYPQCTVACDAALLTHDHFDHNHTQSLKGKFQTIRAAGSYAVGSAKITAVPCFHDEVRGAKRGPNLIYRIEADGVTLAHLGDLGHMPNDEQLKALSGLDLMLIPVGGYFTIETPQAEEIIALAKPRCAVATHYRIHANDTNPISTVEQFEKDMNAVRMPNVIELTPETVAKLPAAIIMDYKA